MFFQKLGFVLLVGIFCYFKNERFELEEVEELTKKMIENLISDSELISTSELGYQSVEIYSAIRKAFEEKCIVNFPLEGKYYEMVFSVT